MLGFTIDSVTLFVSWEQCTALPDFDLNNFKNLIKAKKKAKGSYKDRYVGGYRNFYIDLYENFGVYIKGSISNFYSGYDSLLHHSQLRRAIKKLGNKLGLYLHSARLYRVDLALNILTDNNISQYTHRLFTDLSRFKRLEQDNGVRFQTTDKVFAIYNKTQELKDKRGIKIDHNILRLEFRLFKNVSKNFKLEEMEIQDLYSCHAFRLLVKTFQIFYDKIKKQTVLTEFDNLENITPTDLGNYLKRVGLAVIGEAEGYKLIEQFSVQGKFKSANDKKRCRDMFTGFSNNTAISKINPLVEEINIKVNRECTKILGNSN